MAQELLSSTPEDLSTEAGLAAAWKQEWESAGPTRIHCYIQDLGGGIEGEEWTLLNRLRTGSDATAVCGETAEHIITTRPLYKPPL